MYNGPSALHSRQRSYSEKKKKEKKRRVEAIISFIVLKWAAPWRMSVSQMSERVWDAEIARSERAAREAQVGNIYHSGGGQREGRLRCARDSEGQCHITSLHMISAFGGESAVARTRALQDPPLARAREISRREQNKWASTDRLSDYFLHVMGKKKGKNMYISQGIKRKKEKNSDKQ